VVGDDPDSEIAAALTLGIEAVLYSKNPSTLDAFSGVSVINSFENLYSFL
jgi:FMN phosphatase YigB (HAD superfamily)